MDCTFGEEETPEMLKIVLLSDKTDHDEERKRKCYLDYLNKNSATIPKRDVNVNLLSNICLESTTLSHISPNLKSGKTLSPAILREGSLQECITMEAALRKELDDVIIVMGRGGPNVLTFHVFLHDQGSWSLDRAIPIDCLRNRSCIIIGSCIYFIGGTAGDTPDEHVIDKLFIYDIKTEQLRIGPALRVARAEAGIIACNHVIFVVGGVTKYMQPTTHVEAFDSVHLNWLLVPPMKYKRRHPGVVCLNGVIYVIGGCTISCERYQGFWCEIESLPECYKDAPMIATSLKEQIIAFRSFRPRRICIMDETRQGWKLFRTSGTPPEEIEDSFEYEGSVYAVTRHGKLFVLDLTVRKWYESIRCPKTLNYIYHINCINLKRMVKL